MSAIIAWTLCFYYLPSLDIFQTSYLGEILHICWYYKKATQCEQFQLYLLLAITSFGTLVMKENLLYNIVVIVPASIRNFQIVTKTIPEKNTFNWIDAWRMFFIEFLVIHETVISRRAPSGSIWIKDYRIIYFFVCRGHNAAIFFDRGLYCLVSLLRKL